MARRERDTYVHIVVQDGKKQRRKPTRNDKVEVDGAALKYDEQKGFVYKLQEGVKEIELRIAYQRSAELRQWFIVRAQPRRPKLIPYWPGKKEVYLPTDSARYDNEESRYVPGQGVHFSKKRRNYLLECMSWHRSKGGHGSRRSPVVFTITVTLLPTREYVAAIGTDYYTLTGRKRGQRSGLPFRHYSVTFAKHLYLRQLVNVSSPFTMLDCERGVEERWMRAKGKGWRRQYLLREYPETGEWASFPDYERWHQDVKAGRTQIGGYLGATDIYRYLSSKGQSRPGTIIDFSVFSHGFRKGPILYNSDDHIPTSRPRSTRDLDMRYKKDFSTPNTSGWPHLAAAFATGANVHIWGCFATKAIRQAIVQLIQRKSPIYWSRSDGTRVGKTRDWSIRAIKRVMGELSYNQAIANYVNRTTYGAPPGFGSEWIRYRSIPRLVTHLLRGLGARAKRWRLKLLRRITGSIMKVPVTILKRRKRRGRWVVYRPIVRKFYEGAAMGSRRFNIFGYMRYDPAPAARPRAPAGPARQITDRETPR